MGEVRETGERRGRDERRETRRRQERRETGESRFRLLYAPEMQIQAVAGVKQNIAAF